MKINGRDVSNENRLTVFGGVNVIESDDLLFSVAEKFKILSEKLNFNYVDENEISISISSQIITKRKYEIKKLIILIVYKKKKKISPK